jgi:TonB family protein
VLRVTSTAVIACALGFSAVVHAGVLLVPAFGYFGHPPSVAAAETTVDLVNDVTPVEPAPTEEAAVPRATIFPNHTHPYPVPADHDAIPHDPNLVHVHAPPSAPAVVAAAAPAVTASDALPTFTIAIGATGADSFGNVAAAATAAPEAASPPPVFAEQRVDTPARLVRGLAPSYPAGARANGVEGDVGLELVVDDDGIVESARVVRSVGQGLDQSALQAIRQFRFAPATKDGHPVHVRMGWSMQFRLQ